MVWFPLFGLVAGWLASIVMKGRRHGLLGYLIIGVIGALLGGWLFGLLGLGAGGLIGSLITAFLGCRAHLSPESAPPRIRRKVLREVGNY